MFAAAPPEEFEAALDATVAQIFSATGVAGPPIDAQQIARALTLTVAWDARLAGRARIVQWQTGEGFHGSILLRPEPRPERRQWAIAHEIGEAAAEQVFRLLAADPRDAPAATRERIANQLAGRILLPSDWFFEAGAACDWDLLELKRVFATASHELIARRMLDRSAALTMTVFDHGARTWRRSPFGRAGQGVSFLEQACWRAAHERAEPAERQDDSMRVRAWPIHEPNWKREILQTEFASEE
ncbi:MAG TPA: ImmA/IrrE family metallo-endopeptidase [Pirellulales bacterium]|jgi:hypothetical protein|nr:ImmA/IrrE family metallo-endopeptidase [Pirellulales bacterium]